MIFKVRIAVLSGIAFLFLTGCSVTLPSAKPLVDSSIELEKSSEASFQAVENTSTTVLDNLDPNDHTRDSYRKTIERVEGEAAVRK